ncbi:MAG TPA: serine hydrolase [Gemmatimonadales bacterium]|nr:serine hydrolase [Gemmatimonadales bacterium]
MPHRTPGLRTASARRGAVLAALCGVALARSLPAQDLVPPRHDYAQVVEALTRFIEAQIAEKKLPALSIALVDDQQTVWARGFGLANPADSTPATAATPYRVASVSKLFTDIAVMQLVEAGRVALDTPLTRYVPDIHPVDPFGQPITLRELLSHRSGLVREPPVGNYFDPTSPTLAATARSLDSTTLVYAPGARTKYSNAAIALAGYVVERVTGEPFAARLRRSVLAPLGMTSSSFEPSGALLAGRARGQMWTTDGRTFDAPTFPLGISPAAELTTSMLDLGKFLSALFAGGVGPGGRILADSTLTQMWGVQFGGAGQTSGFGLGFAISRLDGHQWIGHNGWHYGFGTQLAALPQDRLGVAVSTTVDAGMAVPSRVANAALRLMLAAKEGRPLPPIEVTAAVPPADAARLAGRWRGRSLGIDLDVRDGVPWMQPVSGGYVTPLRAIGDTLVVDGRVAYGERIQRGPGYLVYEGDTLRPSPDPEPPPPPSRYLDLVGEYGWDHDVLYVLERDGRLFAQIEWFALYPLTEVSDTLFRFPDGGLYAGEPLAFARGSDGRIAAALVAGVRFPRRSVGTERGVTFHITALKPVDELRRAALAMTPPPGRPGMRKPDLVDVTTLDPRIKLDIRYATSNNFMGTPMYTSARAFLQRPAAEAVARAARWLAGRGYGLLIHDAYRPWYVTETFWDATPEPLRIFVADPKQGSHHNRGCAVDLTLYDLATGQPVGMVGGYDEFSARSFADYPGGTGRQRWHRALLRRAMEAQGFTVYDAEWWHFDFRDWARYPVLNLTFEQLAGRHDH